MFACAIAIGTLFALILHRLVLEDWRPFRALACIWAILLRRDRRSSVPAEPVLIPATAARPKDDTKHFYARVAVSAVVLVCCFYIVLSQQFAEADQKFAYGSIGMVIGHWLTK